MPSEILFPDSIDDFIWLRPCKGERINIFKLTAELRKYDILSKTEGWLDHCDIFTEDVSEYKVSNDYIDNDIFDNDHD